MCSGDTQDRWILDPLRGSRLEIDRSGAGTLKGLLGSTGDFTTLSGSMEAIDDVDNKTKICIYWMCF